METLRLEVSRLVNRKGIVSFRLPELDAFARIHKPPATAIQPELTVGGARDVLVPAKLDSRTALRSELA